MKRPLSIAVLVASIGVLIAGGVVLSNPLRRSEEHIKERLLVDTPIGTSVAEARSFIVSRGWHLSDQSERHGFLKQAVDQSRQVVGVQSLRSHLGYYYGPFRVDVTAFWGFDESGKLIEVWIWKITDAL